MGEQHGDRQLHEERVRCLQGQGSDLPYAVPDVQGGPGVRSGPDFHVHMQPLQSGVPGVRRGSRRPRLLLPLQARQPEAGPEEVQAHGHTEPEAVTSHSGE